MTFKFSQNSLDKLAGVNPDLIAVCNKALELSPTDFTIVQGSRTQAYQDELYAQGRTAPGKIVTWTTHSRHIDGFAIDFAAWINGSICWDVSLYSAIVEAFKSASLALSVPIVCGIDWHPADFGHVQLDSAEYPDD